MPGAGGEWLDGGDREVLEEAVQRLRGVVPGGGTSLYAAFRVIRQMRPAPDNVYLLVDGLPTRGARAPRRATISGKDRLKLFEEAVKEIGMSVPINIILFPMEGDPDGGRRLLEARARLGRSLCEPLQGLALEPKTMRKRGLSDEGSTDSACPSSTSFVAASAPSSCCSFSRNRRAESSRSDPHRARGPRG